jgi:signal transduction histidine kinase
MTDSSRRAALGALAAELGHELQGPLNLFRLATDRAARGEPLDAEDISLLREELERLTRVCARLRALATSSLARRACRPDSVIEAALEGIDLGQRSKLELEEGTKDEKERIDCDPSLLGLALRELIDNALRARAERAGVRFVCGERTGFCVWDDGPGFGPEAERLLGWGATSKPGAAGMGLTVALRVARAHGFRLEVARQAAETQVWLVIVARDRLGEPSKLEG